MLAFLNNFLLICDFCRPLKDALFCNPQTSVEDIHDSLNACTDRLFKVVDGFLADYVEPMQLPDLHSGFNYTLVASYYGNVDLSGGLLQNLSTLRRSSDLSYHKNNRRFKMTLPLVFTSLTFSYHYSAKIMGFGPSGTIQGHLNNLKMEVTFGFDYVDLMVTLDKFQITNSEYLDLEFAGHDFIDWIFNFLTDMVTVLLKKNILTNMEKIIGDALQVPVKEINGVIGEYSRSRFLPLFLQRLQLSASTVTKDDAL